MYCLTVPKLLVEENFSVSDSFLRRKFSRIRRLRNAYHDFQSVLFCLTVPKLFLEDPFCVSAIFLCRKMIFRIRGAELVVYFHTFLSVLFRFKVPKPFLEETFSVIDSLQYRKSLRIGGKRAPFESFRRNCSVSVYWHISFSNRSVFEIVSRIEKGLGYVGGAYHGFPSRLICLTVPKHFVEERSCVSEIFLCWKVLWIRRDRAPIESFRRNCFVSQYQNNSQRSPSVFLKVYWTRKFQRQDEKGRLSRVSVEMVVSQCKETFFRGTLMCFKTCPVSKSSWKKRGHGGGESRSSVETVGSLYRNVSWWITSVIQKISGIQSFNR